MEGSTGARALEAAHASARATAWMAPTSAPVAATRAVVRAAAQPDKPNAVIPVTLLVAPSQGHSKIDQAHELLATWLINRFPGATK